MPLRAYQKPTNFLALYTVRFSFFCRNGGDPPVVLRVILSPVLARGAAEKCTGSVFEVTGAGQAHHEPQPVNRLDDLCVAQRAARLHQRRDAVLGRLPVSYTHLTLPTSDLV